MRPAPARTTTAVAVAIVAVLGPAGCFDDAAPPGGPGPSAYATMPAGPEIGAWHGLVYDDRLGATVLVNGGPERVAPPDRRLELWSWNGTSWSTQETPQTNYNSLTTVSCTASNACMAVGYEQDVTGATWPGSVLGGATATICVSDLTV